MLDRLDDFKRREKVDNEDIEIFWSIHKFGRFLHYPKILHNKIKCDPHQAMCMFDKAFASFPLLTRKIRT
jgi:hypothetical protein